MPRPPRRRDTMLVDGLRAVRLLVTGRWTADELAAELGVGRRTTYRILDALGCAGMAVEHHREGRYVYLRARRDVVTAALGLDVAALGRSAPPRTRAAVPVARVAGDPRALELWRPVPGYEADGIEVSTLGRVRRTVLQQEPVAIRSDPATGYLTVHIRRGETRGVAALVLRAFRGPPRVREVACYRNGDASDARLANVDWATFGRARSLRWRTEPDVGIPARTPDGLGADGVAERASGTSRRGGPAGNVTSRRSSRTP